MKMERTSSILSVVLILVFVLPSCSMSIAEPASIPASKDTPQPTSTITLTSTNRPKPSLTPRPTKTPDLAATERIEGFNAEMQSYFDKGYIKTTNGKIEEIHDFWYDWAKIDWYRWFSLNQVVSDFYLSAHFKWSSAIRNVNPAGCGIIFAIQDNGDHYAVFLDRSSVIFFNKDKTSNYSKYVGLTRGTGRVKLDNPADHPVEADFTLIVTGTYSYVLVNGEVVGEYTLSQSKILKGDIGLSVLSGINKGYGTRCEMTNVRIWVPNS
jgi:hypothetical protein